MSDVIKSGKFIKVKILSIVLAILGVVCSIVCFTVETTKWQDYKVDALTYSFTNPFSGETVYHSGSDIGELSLIEFIKSDNMNNAIWLEAIVVLVVFVVLACLIFAFYFNQGLTITRSGITGKAVFGKTVELDFCQITSVKKSFLNGVLITTTGQDKIKFRLIKNQSELIEIIHKNISNVPLSSGSEKPSNENSADQLMQLKELLDSGIISQEEFDAKKKQLLGL